MKPTTAAVALYFAGVLVESLGLGLIAAYGSVVAGGTVAVVGLAAGWVGDHRWSASAQGVSTHALVTECFSWLRSTGVFRRRGEEKHRPGVTTGSAT